MPYTKNKEVDEEINTWVTKQIEDFKQKAKDNKEESAPYDFIITSQSYSYQEIKTIYLLKYTDTKEAHYEREDKVFHYNEKTLEKVTLLDFLKGEDSLTALSSLSYFNVMEQAESYGTAPVEELVKEGTSPKIENFQYFYFNEEGLHLLFPPYQVAPGSIGEVDLTLSYKDINELLKTPGEIKEAEKAPALEKKTRDLEQLKNKKLLAITFDDGPSKKVTTNLLTELDKTDWKVTFFLLGNRAKENHEIVKRAYQAGHEIASHTYSHLNLKKLTDYEAYKEIKKQTK